MLDPTFCAQNTLTNYWGELSWTIFRILCRPILIVPILLGLIGLPWLIKPLRWKRQISVFWGVVLLCYALVASPSVITLGNRLLVGFLPVDSGKPADAIVVLGRGGELREKRVEVAARLWEKKRAPLIFASGRGDAEEIAQMLEAKGVPAQDVDGEPCSLTTQENALFTAALLKPRQVHRIILVTDPSHMLRSMLTFRSLGFEVLPHSSPIPYYFDTRARAFLMLREYVSLVGYGLRGRFSPQEIPSADSIGLGNPSSRQLNPNARSL
jgi:uncharacterized SAM-binding protein YcdF (DUF218 family)